MRDAVYCSLMLPKVSVFVLALVTATLSGQSKPDWQGRRESCVERLSTFATEASTMKPPQIPDDLDSVALEYSASGCYGRCPAFKMRVEKGRVVWERHAFVKKKGKAERRISPQVLRNLVRAWLDADIYAMRDDYCGPTCPDGTVMVITDVQETSITLQSPSYSKTVLECFTTIDGKPQTPKPPQQYFRLSQQLLQFAKSNRWL
jgi:uncharacterized protein DUF6438